MSAVYDIRSTCLRYIVPFRYEESFEEAFLKIENQKGIKNDIDKKLWERKKVNIEGVESDLYRYIRNELRFPNDTQPMPDEKVGAEWIFCRSEESLNKNGQKIKELIFYPEGLKKKRCDSGEEWDIPEGWNLTVANLGLELFRNGLGFLWYELKLPSSNFNSDQLKSFQYSIRELNRNMAAQVWEKQKIEPDYGIVLHERNGYKTYLRPFLFGKWIDETIGFLKVSYFAERKSSYSSMVKNSMSMLKGIKKEIVKRDNQTESGSCYLPDKAILFSYISLQQSFEESTEEKYSLVYHLTNGYKDSYHFSEDLMIEMKRPFKDVYWYATQEGAAYIVWPDEENRAVFESLIPVKVKTDYFSLYLKILYQSFSLMLYAEKIQAEISAVSGKYLTEPFDKRITELFEEINLFLTKSMATSVSHIHHQSEFYVYLKKQLRIREDVESVTAGLNALDALQREQRQREEKQRQREEDIRVEEAWREDQKRAHEAQTARLMREEREKKSDGKIQAIMGLFALLGIASALVDCFDFIGKFDAEGDFWKLMEGTRSIVILFMVLVGIVSVIAIYFSVKAIVNAFRDVENQ